jgi:hypothetical protein
VNVLDESVPPSQRRLLRSWRVPIRHFGYEIGRRGMQDDEIIPFLLGLRRPTFFSLDFDFYKRTLCHARYCLVSLDVKQYEAATFVRRLLRHPQFSTGAKRMGAVIRVSHAGLTVWRLHQEEVELIDWMA